MAQRAGSRNPLWRMKMGRQTRRLPPPSWCALAMRAMMRTMRVAHDPSQQASQMLCQRRNPVVFVTAGHWKPCQSDTGGSSDTAGHVPERDVGGCGIACLDAVEKRKTACARTRPPAAERPPAATATCGTPGPTMKWAAPRPAGLDRRCLPYAPLCQPRPAPPAAVQP